MEPIRINPDEFKLENFINYYNDNVEELLSEYPNYVSRICLIDRDYMDVVIFDEDYEELEDASDYKKLLLNGEYALHFAIGKTYEGAEKVEFIDGKKYILNHYLDDIYEDNSTIKDIGELSLNVDNLIGLLFDFEEEDEEIVISVVDFEHGGGLSNPRIREVDDSGDIENILKEKPHVLDKKEEELLAAASDCLDAPSSIHNIMTNADMKFGNIKDEDGEEVELTEGNYSSFIKSKDRNVRKAAFERLFGEYKSFENTLATTLSSSIKVFNFGAKIRNYNSALEASLKPNDIPTEVYTNAVKTINDNLSSLHRYVKLKKKLLGLEEMHMYDLYVPVIEVPKEHVEFDKAVEMAVEGLNPLGKEYLDIFQGGINGGWIDKYINKGKRGGAYSWGGYDTKPYVLLNYNYELNDVSTLVHEMGHSIHSYYSRKEQSYYYAGYTLFCAEVASTTNEALLIHHLINKETDKKKKLYLINQELEQIRTTVFRQLMFAEFELYTHESFEKGLPLTAQDYNAKWHELNVKYFGPDMVVDSDIDVEWSRIPHFYSDFYVYQYATGYAAASAFANSILNGEKDAVEKYVGFLKSGGSDYPIEILKKAGVDMTTSKPLEATINRFNELLDMLEKEI